MKIERKVRPGGCRHSSIGCQYFRPLAGYIGNNAWSTLCKRDAQFADKSGCFKGRLDCPTELIQGPCGAKRVHGIPWDRLAWSAPTRERPLNDATETGNRQNRHRATKKPMSRRGSLLRNRFLKKGAPFWLRLLRYIRGTLDLTGLAHAFHQRGFLPLRCAFKCFGSYLWRQVRRNDLLCRTSNRGRFIVWNNLVCRRCNQTRAIFCASGNG